MIEYADAIVLWRAQFDKYQIQLSNTKIIYLPSHSRYLTKRQVTYMM